MLVPEGFYIRIICSVSNSQFKPWILGILFWWLWFLGFAGKIFQFLVRPGNVGNYGFNFTLRHPLSLWKMKNDTFVSLVPGQKCSGPKSIGPKYFRAEVFSGLKYSPGRSIFWAEVVSGPKLFQTEVFPGQSECRAKVVSGPNWVWAFFLAQK